MTHSGVRQRDLMMHAQCPLPVYYSQLKVIERFCYLGYEIEKDNASPESAVTSSTFACSNSMSLALLIRVSLFSFM